MTHISAGSLIVVGEGAQQRIVLLYREETRTYHLPKGTQEKGESLHETVVREIKEETGLTIIPTIHLCDLDSTFLRDAQVVHKQTSYFLSRIGEFSPDVSHDAEHDQLVCVPITEALHLLETSGGERLGFEDEVRVVRAWTAL